MNDNAPSNPTNIRSVADVLCLTRKTLHRRATVKSAEEYELKNGAPRIRLTLEVVAQDGTPVELPHEFPADEQHGKFINMRDTLMHEADANTQSGTFTLDQLNGRRCVVELDLQGRVQVLVRTTRAIERKRVSKYPDVVRRAEVAPVVAPPPVEVQPAHLALRLDGDGAQAHCAACIAEASIDYATPSVASIRLSILAWGERGAALLRVVIDRPSPAWTELTTALGVPPDVELERLGLRSCEAVATARASKSGSTWVELGGFRASGGK